MENKVAMLQRRINSEIMSGSKLALKQPKLLQALLNTKLINLILEKSTYIRDTKRVMAISDADLQQLREYFQILPVTVRFELLQEALFKKYDVSYSGLTIEEANFVFTMIFLASDMDKVDYSNFVIWFLKSVHVKSLLQFLVTEMKNLKVLALPLIYQVEIKSLVSATKFSSCLHDLILRNNCVIRLELPGSLSDSLLQVIAKFCHHIQILDIFGTSGITDYGLCNLTQVWECQNKIQSIGGNLDEDFQKFHPSALEKASIHLSGSKEQLLQVTYAVSRSRLCQTLRAINLSNTSVTRKGISTLLSLVDNLENISMELDDFLDGLYEEQQQQEDVEVEFPYWNLRFVHVKELTENRMKMLKLIRTKPITRLSISDMMVSESEFNNYVTVYCTFLTTLVLSRTLHTPDFKISFFLKQCPNLKRLIVREDYGNDELMSAEEPMQWGEENKPVLTSTLTRVDISTSVSARTVELLLQSATRLQEAKFKRIVDDSNLLLSLWQLPISKELKILMVCSGNVFANANHLSKFWLKNQNIRVIGTVEHKVSDLGLGENIDLTFKGSETNE